MKKISGILSVLFALMIAASAVLLISCGGGTATGAKTKGGGDTPCTFTFIAVGKDGGETRTTITSAGKHLGEALETAGLIKGENGMVYSVYGERADYSLDGAYWAFYIGDEYAMTGIYATKPEEGCVYKLVYTAV